MVGRYKLLQKIGEGGCGVVFSSPRQAAGALGGPDLYIPTRTDPSDPLDFVPPVNLGPAVNSPAQDFAPSISADGLTLYFSTTRSGPPEMRVAKRSSSDEPFDQATPIRLEGRDPFISADGTTLYFEVGNDLWQTPELMQAPLSISRVEETPSP